MNNNINTAQENWERERKAWLGKEKERLGGRLKKRGRKEKKTCRDQDSNLGYYGHNVMS